MGLLCSPVADTLRPSTPTGSLWTIQAWQSGCNTPARPPCGGQLLAPFNPNDRRYRSAGSCHSVRAAWPASARSAIEPDCEESRARLSRSMIIRGASWPVLLHTLPALGQSGGRHHRGKTPANAKASGTGRSDGERLSEQVAGARRQQRRRCSSDWWHQLSPEVQRASVITIDHTADMVIDADHPGGLLPLP